MLPEADLDNIRLQHLQVNGAPPSPALLGQTALFGRTARFLCGLIPSQAAAAGSPPPGTSRRCQRWSQTTARVQESQIGCCRCRQSRQSLGLRQSCQPRSDFLNKHMYSKSENLILSFSNGHLTSKDMAAP